MWQHMETTRLHFDHCNCEGETLLCCSPTVDEMGSFVLICVVSPVRSDCYQLAICRRGRFFHRVLSNEELIDRGEM